MTDYRQMIADQQARKKLRDQRVKEVTDEQIAKGRTATGRMPSREPIAHQLPRTISGENFFAQAADAERRMDALTMRLRDAGHEQVQDSFIMTEVDGRASDDLMERLLWCDLNLAGDRG